MSRLSVEGKVWLAIASLLFLGLSRVGAQDSGETAPPTAPFVKPPPDFASWTMTVSRADGSQLPQPAPPATGKTAPTALATLELRQQQVAQTGKIRQEIDTWSDATKTEDWLVNGIRLHQHPLSHSILVFDPAHMGDLMVASFARYDFLTIGWLSPDTYLRAENYKKHLCYHFQKSGGPDQAWIDVATKQTVAYNDGSKLYSYVYGPPPASELVLPPEYAKAWKQYQDTMNPLILHLPSTK